VDLSCNERSPMIRVLVADDSATSRTLLVELLSAEPDFKVIGEATNGQEAVEMAQRLAPDLITMDVQMPVMDGLEATKQIMVRSPRPIIIISHTARDDEVSLSLEATRAGALMVLPKPDGPLSPRFASDRRQIVSMARAMSQVKVVRRHGASAPYSVVDTPPPRAAYTPASSARSHTARDSIRLVAIAASTGGPAAIQTVLADLPRSFPVPILVVQHISSGFTSGLARWLSGDTALRVKVAELGEPADAGTVYIAPDDLHIGCRVDKVGVIRIVLDNGPALGAFRPSASYLFRSAAETLGASVLSVILTGMGDDGIAGLRAAKAAGGRVIAQDEASSVIFGMPREAARAGVVDWVVGLNGIARRLMELTA
jgi:two-component system, chemotaxis family, protein-glutamate methylesterase/glutaminase